ncbi:MAG TPA: ATP-binding protein [Ktedonobacterales bacterium]
MTSVAMVTDRGPQGEQQAHARQRQGFFNVLRRWHTYGNVIYLLLALPLSYIYAVAFGDLWSIVTVSLSILAVPVFLLACSWIVAYFERWLAHWLLGIVFMPMATPLPPGTTLWERTKAHLRNPVTWKCMAYLIVRVPLGFVGFFITAILLLIPIVIVLAPVLYLMAVAYADPVWASYQGGNHLYDLFTYYAHTLSQVLGLGNQIQPAPTLVSVLIGALGVVVLAGALHLINGVAYAWGWVARAMLGVNPKDLQLAEAQMMAAEARARAEQAESGRRQLILDASHELRTPAATVRARIESLLLLEGEQLPEHLRAYLAVTQREAERLAALVDDLLMLARADTDKLQLDIRPVDARDVIEEVFRALEPLAERERQVTLVRDIAEALPPVYADRDRLAQVLLNLTRNAINYTPAGGLVSIALTAGDTPATLVLTVTDTGIGIAEEDLEQVFERFYRTDASRARHTGGFGLGLSIVRDLVEAMGGSVVAEQVPTGGSRFRVTLRAAHVPVSG